MGVVKLELIEGGGGAGHAQQNYCHVRQADFQGKSVCSCPHSDYWLGLAAMMPDWLTEVVCYGHGSKFRASFQIWLASYLATAQPAAPKNIKDLLLRSHTSFSCSQKLWSNKMSFFILLACNYSVV